ncbi:hypothetical protein [Kibdelosporangium phytohabitans]|uniref:Uncharacterized protein n=1 Tax=Kibdelosporangium phytohabitans TaxID=860235 RepID=A0A0N7F337_9PSEU|nr:hypothetical protein [Kibdelosporangium phytohabitans]ALG07543.1 hypothetical protein AOZ06_12010 [Kibdelosporangium phytohabitans]MBE1471531.1 hypothetical protein [Kibdelosporangium phytohabitans]
MTGVTMTGNDQAHVERLAALLRPVDLLDFVTHVCQWLQDAHDAAAELQPVRKNNHRGTWSNNTSFGTDRYEYLLRTAQSLSVDIPGLDADPAFQSVLLKLDHVGVYQFNAPAGPHGSLGDISDLRRELLAPQEDEALIGRRDAWLDGRELLLLPWAGAEDGGLTDAWAGQGTLTDGHISWDWLVRLQDIAAVTTSGQVPWLGSQSGPTLFDQSPPELPLRPRTEQRHGSAG